MENNTHNNIFFADKIRNFYEYLCFSEEWATVDEIIARNSHNELVYEKIRRFRHDSDDPLLEIDVILRKEYAYTPKWHRRMWCNDCCANNEEYKLPLQSDCRIYDFINDIPEQYHYEGDFVKHLWCRYGDKSILITPSMVKDDSPWSILSIIYEAFDIR